MKIIADDRIPFVRDYFDSVGELILKPGRDISRADVKKADVLLVRSVTNVDETLLAGSRVKCVGSVTAGADHLDKKWLASKKIACLTADGFNAPAVADYIVSIIAALQRKHDLLVEMKKAAVIGVGNVGSLVVERLKLLGFDVIMCDPFRAENEEDFTSVPMAEIAGMDFVTLHVPLVMEGAYPTFNMINEEFLLRQKSGCVLLNTSRGDVINAHDLVKLATQTNLCLDVWSHEPGIDKTILQQALLATPHIAGYSVQSKMRGTDMIYWRVCEMMEVKPAVKAVLSFPHQEIFFAGESHHWQDIVLGIYNPVVTTAMMRATLLPADNHAYYFDEMRHQFRYRHEFAYTTVVGTVLSKEDQRLMETLGCRVG